MTFDVMRVTLGGAMGTSERWSINPCFQFGDLDQDTPTFVEMKAAADAVLAIAFPPSLINLLSTLGNFDAVRLEARKATGELEVVGEAFKTTPTPGLRSITAPFQTAAVLSVRSATAGSSGRGRLYVPAVAAQMSSGSGRWSNTERDTVLAALKTYLSAIGAAMGTALGFPAGTVTVWSRTKAQHFPAISLQMGDVLDTQRRRRDSLPESYAAVAYP